MESTKMPMPPSKNISLATFSGKVKCRRHSEIICHPPRGDFASKVMESGRLRRRNFCRKDAKREFGRLPGRQACTNLITMALLREEFSSTNFPHSSSSLFPGRRTWKKKKTGAKNATFCTAFFLLARTVEARYQITRVFSLCINARGGKARRVPRCCDDKNEGWMNGEENRRIFLASE